MQSLNSGVWMELVLLTASTVMVSGIVSRARMKLPVAKVCHRVAQTTSSVDRLMETALKSTKFVTEFRIVQLVAETKKIVVSFSSKLTFVCVCVCVCVCVHVCVYCRCTSLDSVDLLCMLRTVTDAMRNVYPKSGCVETLLLFVIG